MHYDPNERWDEFLLEVAAKRKENGITHKDLADSTGMVERSVSRLLSEPAKNPSFFPVVTICEALHISLDKYFVPSVYSKGSDRLTDDVAHKAEMIDMLKDQVRQRRKLSNILLVIIFVLLAMMVLYLVLIDAQNLNYGLIRG